MMFINIEHTFFIDYCLQIYHWQMKYLLTALNKGHLTPKYYVNDMLNVIFQLSA